MKIDQHTDQKQKINFVSWPYVCTYLVTDFGTNRYKFSNLGDA